MLAIAILGILGFTHIRKDFGEKTGILFSFLTFFLPVMTIYASEIRMYSWAALFVTITGIYGYRLTKQNSIKNWIIFGIFSLCSLYTHYYGVMAAGLINVFLFVFFIKRKDIRKQYLSKFLITGISQFVLYIPWLYCMYIQIKNVSKGFWITLSFPGTIFEIMDFQCLGNLDERTAVVLSLSLFALAFFTMNKSKKETNNAGKQAIILYFSVIIAAGLLSIKTPILYPRYMFVVTGLLIFFWSFFISKNAGKKTIYTVCGLILVLSIYSNILFIKTNYDSTNTTQIKFIQENIQNGDKIIFKNQELGSGSVIDVNFDGYETFFYDAENWNVEKAYEAYAPDMKIIKSLDDLENITGRIWIIDTSDYSLYNMISEKYQIELMEKKTIKTKYKDYNYNFALINK